MRHIDDGILHAYLDGALHALAAAGALPDGAAAADVEAHFRSCADCRARLEAERDVRDRAAVVLDDARPAAIDIPPFELVGARAHTQTRPRSALPYAWAASVLLALGAGWIGGELLRRDAGFETAQSSRADGLERSASANPPAPAQLSADPAVTAPAAAAVAGADPPERAAGSGERSAESAERPAAVPPGRVAEGPGARDAADPAVAESITALRQRVVAAPDAVARRETAPAAGDRLATQSRQVAASSEQLAARPLGQPLAGTDTMARRAAAMLAAAAESRLAAAPVPAPAAPPLPPPAAPAPVASASALMAPAPGAASALVGVDVPQVFREHVARSRAGTLTWLPLSADDQRRSGTPVLTVEDGGLPVVESAIAGPGALLRVRQRLATGEEVELLLWRAPAIALDEAVVVGTPLRAAPVRGRQGAGEPARPVRHEVSVTALAGGVQEIILHELASGTWIALSGAVPLAQLRQAASRLVARP